MAEEVPELHVQDPAVVAVLYDPVRYGLFRLLETPRSVAELAAEVGVPANRLYYHVRRLVECGLVRQVDARPSGKHTERIYGRAATRIRFSGELDLDAGAGGLLRGIMDELETGIRNARDDEAPNMLSYHVVSLAPERAAELEERLRTLISGYERESIPTSAGRRFGLLGAIVPLEEEPADDGDS